MNTLKALKRCSLGLDLVPVADLPHLLHFVFRLRLSWRQLYRQFGTDPAKASDKRIIVKIFRRKALRELKKIKLAWPESELRDGQRGVDPLSLEARHSYSAAAFAREISCQHLFRSPRLVSDSPSSAAYRVGPPEPLKTTSTMSCGDAAVRFIHRCL